MSFRCINGFAFVDAIYPGGYLAEDDDPILKTHADHFAKVERPIAGRATETASAAPGELRDPQLAAADIEAWLAAETQHEENVQAWLLTEEEHQAATAAETPAPEPTKTATHTRRRRTTGGNN